MNFTDSIKDFFQQFVVLILRGCLDPSTILEEDEVLARYSMDWEKCYQLIAANDEVPLGYSIIRDQGILPPILE